MRQIKIVALLAIALILMASVANAETLTELKAKMDKFADSFHGTLGYSLLYRDTLVPIQSGLQDKASGLRDKGVPKQRTESISRNGDEPFPTASTIKTTIMCEVMHQVEQGKIKWSDQVQLRPESAREDGGYACYFKDGTKLPVDQWVDLMITMSDNTATMLLRDYVGQKNVNDWLTANGFKVTKLLSGKQSSELGLRQLQRQYGLGMTTPNEMARLLEMIRDNKAGSRASCERMMRLLSHQYWDDYISSQVPPMHCANKTGFIDGTRADVALVTAPKGEYILTVYIKNGADESYSHTNEGDCAIRSLAAMVWQHYDPKKTWSPPDGHLNLLPAQ